MAGKWKTVKSHPLLTFLLPNSSLLFGFSKNKYDGSETEESLFP